MLIVPAQLDTVSTLKDGTIKLVFETNEIPPAKMAELFSFRNQLGYLSFKPETFTNDEIETIESLKVGDFEDGKSPSKRMRSILYRLWQQDSMGYSDPNLYYIYRMNQLCDMLKNEFDK